MTKIFVEHEFFLKIVESKTPTLMSWNGLGLANYVGRITMLMGMP
jgi:uncharacterized membrane protein